jgi:hypothetical protein
MTTVDLERVRALADRLDCIPEEDFCALGKIAPATAEAWRKRGTGPEYILLGNAYLYPKEALAEFLRSRTRERKRAPGKATL